MSTIEKHNLATPSSSSSGFDDFGSDTFRSPTASPELSALSPSDDEVIENLALKFKVHQGNREASIELGEETSFSVQSKDLNPINVESPKVVAKPIETESNKTEPATEKPKDCADDTFLDTWDLRIHRCTNCRRPFTSSHRLKKHECRQCGDVDFLLYQGFMHLTLGDTETEDIVPEGDLILVVRNGSEMGAFRVASQVLRLASSVFRERLSPYSNSHEARAVRRAALDPSTPAVMTIEVDYIDISLVEQILNILHHQVPSGGSYEFMWTTEIFAITEFAMEFKLVGALEHWMDIWMREWDSDEGRLEYGHEDLFIAAWVFRMEDWVQAMTQEVVFRCHVYEDDSGEDSITFEDSSGAHVYTRGFSVVLPRQVLDELLRLRSKLVEPVRQRLRSLRDDLTYHPNQQHSRACCLECDAVQLGHLMQTISRFDLDKDIFWNQSLRVINETLSKLKPFQYNGAPLAENGHQSCDWVSGVVQDVELGLDENPDEPPVSIAGLWVLRKAVIYES